LTEKLPIAPPYTKAGAYYCNPADENTIAEGILKILNNETYSQKLVIDGFKHVQQFESKEISTKLMRAYQSVLSN
jgi:hypothetical protein